MVTTSISVAGTRMTELGLDPVFIGA